MRKLLAGSANPHKIREIRALLDGLPVEVAGAEELGEGEDVEETGSTFSENARLKALAYAARGSGRRRPGAAGRVGDRR